MDLLFDIFRMTDGKTLKWAEPSESLEEANKRVRELGLSFPGTYIIFSQKTGEKTTMVVEPRR